MTIHYWSEPYLGGGKREHWDFDYSDGLSNVAAWIFFNWPRHTMAVA